MLPRWRQIRSSRRKTLAIRVRPDCVEVRAPCAMPQSEIDAFVRKKQRWITHHLQRFADNPVPVPVQYHYQSGEQFPFMGQVLTLSVQSGRQHEVRLQADQLIVTVNSRTASTGQADRVKRLLHEWYRQQALDYLTPLSDQLAAHIGCTPGRIQVRRTRSKWGHCTHRGDLQYNWLIIAAPAEVIFYLVAHEVSHLVHHNHSKAFWQQVEALCPDWRTQREWLKRNGYRLQV
ncbi:MAG: M48 family metallopeptidase [Marinobacterium sp.]|nr:M48 family metallopeptidase [Marinobacterium sp.]